MKIEPVIQTLTGKKVDPTALQFDDISIEDIAGSLAKKCRFNGHCTAFYSIAQHSVFVSSLLKPRTSDLALRGLLHDAFEAYLWDVASPIKHKAFINNSWHDVLKMFTPYRRIEALNLVTIWNYFGLGPLSVSEAESIKEADLRMLRTEYDQFMVKTFPWNGLKGIKPYPFTIDPLLPKEAEDLFIQRYQELTNK
jgi:hypothetical protein